MMQSSTPGGTVDDSSSRQVRMMVRCLIMFLLMSDLLIRGLHCRLDPPDDLNKALEEFRDELLPSRHVTCKYDTFDRSETFQQVAVFGVIRHIGDSL